MTEESITVTVEEPSADVQSQDGDVASMEQHEEVIHGGDKVPVEEVIHGGDNVPVDKVPVEKAGSDMEPVEEESKCEKARTANATTSENEEQHVINEDNNRSGELDKLAAKETVAKGAKPRPKRSLRPQGSHADAPQRKAVRSDKIPFWRSFSLRFKNVRGKSCEEQGRSFQSAMESTSNVRVRSRSRNADRVISCRQGLDDSEPAKMLGEPEARIACSAKITKDTVRAGAPVASEASGIAFTKETGGA